MDRDERRGAGSVDRDARSTKIEQVRDTVGGDAERVAGAGVGVDAAEVAELGAAVIVVRDTDEDAGTAAGKFFGGLPRVFQCFPGYFEQKALLRIHPRRLARRDAEELGIELIDLIDKATPSRVYLARDSWIRIVNLVEIEAVGGHFGDCVESVADGMPELLRTAAAGKTAADSDNRDRIGFHLTARVRS